MAAAVAAAAVVVATKAAVAAGQLSHQSGDSGCLAVGDETGTALGGEQCLAAGRRGPGAAGRTAAGMIGQGAGSAGKAARSRRESAGAGESSPPGSSTRPEAPTGETVGQKAAVPNTSTPRQTLLPGRKAAGTGHTMPRGAGSPGRAQSIRRSQIAVAVVAAAVVECTAAEKEAGRVGERGSSRCIPGFRRQNSGPQCHNVGLPRRKKGRKRERKRVW